MDSAQLAGQTWPVCNKRVLLMKMRSYWLEVYGEIQISQRWKRLKESKGLKTRYPQTPWFISSLKTRTAWNALCKSLQLEFQMSRHENFNCHFWGILPIFYGQTLVALHNLLISFGCDFPNLLPKKLLKQIITAIIRKPISGYFMLFPKKKLLKQIFGSKLGRFFRQLPMAHGSSEAPALPPTVPPTARAPAWRKWGAWSQPGDPRQGRGSNAP